MKTPDNKSNTPVTSPAMPYSSRRGFTTRIATLFVAVFGFSMAAGLTDFTSPRAEAAGWLTINRYWKGYHYDNGDWQFVWNDGSVRGTGNYTARSRSWSHFYGYSSTKSYVRQPREWDYQHTIYGTPGPRIYPSL